MTTDELYMMKTNNYVQQIYLNCLVTNNKHPNNETINNNRKKSSILMSPCMKLYENVFINIEAKYVYICCSGT